MVKRGNILKKEPNRTGEQAVLKENGNMLLYLNSTGFLKAYAKVHDSKGEGGLYVRCSSYNYTDGETREFIIHLWIKKRNGNVWKKYLHHNDRTICCLPSKHA